MSDDRETCRARKIALHRTGSRDDSFGVGGPRDGHAASMSTMGNAFASAWILGASSLLLYESASAELYRLAIQPTESAATMKRNFQPFANYLSRETGQDIRLEIARNIASHWRELRRDRRFDFVLDAAHMTDFLVKKLNYQVIGKIQGATSYSVVTTDDNPITEPEGLIGKRVASLASPDVGALRLISMFHDPIRRPHIVEVESPRRAAEKVVAGEVFAAIIPTPLISDYPSLKIVLTTEQVPAQGFSVAAKVPASVREGVRAALLRASRSELGRQVLKKAGLAGFEPASAKIFHGYLDLLSGTWGFGH